MPITDDKLKTNCSSRNGSLRSARPGSGLSLSVLGN